jgi:hypothetical protein
MCRVLSTSVSQWLARDAGPLHSGCKWLHMKLIRQSPTFPSDNNVEPVELIDWLSQGESCTLRIGSTSVVVRFIERKGRRARIAVTASQQGLRESDGEVLPDRTRSSRRLEG